NRKRGDHHTRRCNPELGIGRGIAIEGRALVVEFPRSGTKLRLAASTDALIPVDPDSQPGLERSRVERRISGRLDELNDFLTRLDVLHLLTLREADGL